MMSGKESAREELERKPPRKRNRGSQTDDSDENDKSCTCCPSCNVRENTLEEINRKLDLTLLKLGELEVVKEKQFVLERENRDLKKSLEFAYEELEEIKTKMATQRDEVQEELQNVKTTMEAQSDELKLLKKTIEVETNRGIKLESHSRRNNLRFFKIPEKPKESAHDTENILRDFIEKELEMTKKDVDEINIERAHRTIIAKFSFYKEKSHILSQAKKLAGTQYGIAEDFPKEILNVRKRLYPKLVDARKNGKVAKLIYDKLYIDNEIFKDTMPDAENEVFSYKPGSWKV